MSASFETLNYNDFWFPIVKSIIVGRKIIKKRTFSQKEGLLSIRYEFEDGSSATIPMEVLENFIVVEEKTA